MTLYTRHFINSQRVPWRIRNSIEKWTEKIAYYKYPAIYEFLHFGRLHNIVKPVTTGPNHHFFGYYEKSPWNQSGRFLLSHEANFNDRPPNEKDSVKIGIIDLKENNKFKAIATSHAWNWQQGTMAQWHPANPENWILHNDRNDEKYIAIVRDTEGKEIKKYEKPIYAISPCGKHAFSVNFSRLQTYRPGYGYAGVSDPWANSLYPEDDGIHLINIESGKSELIISLHQLANLNATETMLDSPHWINHIQISPNGKRFAFFHIWRIGESGWKVRLYTANMDGSELYCILDTNMISHYDWKDDENILIWAKNPGTQKDNFLYCKDKEHSIKIMGKNILTEDGHCSYSPDRNWVLNDTYPDAYDMRTLMLFDPQNEKRIDLARLYSPKKKWWGEIRCDLHPRWSRDGKQICVDSVHSGERQLYVVNIEEFLK